MMLDSTEPTSAEVESAEIETRGEAARRASPDRSTVAFPYTHLEDALVVVHVLHDSGIPLSRDQIAGKLGVSASSGWFSLKIGAVKIFRLIELYDGKFKLTDLGERILSSDDNEVRSAKRDAFLNVELYQKTFETFRHRNLPSRPTALEDAFVSFGVAPKQGDKARLAFERSAQFAGFFHAGKERLVEPIIVGSFSASARQTREATTISPKVEAAITNPLPEAAQQLLIKGLLERMPPSDAAWSLNERARWLRALAVNLAIIYGADDEGEISISSPAIPQSRVAVLIEKIEKASFASKTKEQPTSQVASSDDLDDEIPF